MVTLFVDQSHLPFSNGGAGVVGDDDVVCRFPTWELRGEHVGQYYRGVGVLQGNYQGGLRSARDGQLPHPVLTFSCSPFVITNSHFDIYHMHVIPFIRSPTLV